MVDLQTAASISQILSIVPGAYSAYAAWVMLQQSQGATPAAAAGTPLTTLAAPTATGLLIAFGAFVALVVLGALLGGLSWRQRSRRGSIEATAVAIPPSPTDRRGGEANLFPPSVSQSPAPLPIYVGRIEPTVDKLATEHWLELSMTVFNGTGAELAIDRHPRGFLICDDNPLDIPASIPQDPSPSGREIQVIIRQHFTDQLARSLRDRIENRGIVTLTFTSFRLLAKPRSPNQIDQEVDIPLPHGVNILYGVKCGRNVAAPLLGGSLTTSGGLG